MRGMEPDGELVDLYLIADTSLKNKLIVAVELQKEWVDVCFFNSCIDDSSWCHRKIDSSVEDCPRNGYVSDSALPYVYPFLGQSSTDESSEKTTNKNRYYKD